MPPPLQWGVYRKSSRFSDLERELAKQLLEQFYLTATACSQKGEAFSGLSPVALRVTRVPVIRVLIATVTAGGGHLQAAAALAGAWRTLHPGDTVRKVDVLDFSPPFYKRLYEKGYEALVKRAPELYALLFKETDNSSLMRKLCRLRRSFSTPRINGSSIT